MTKDSHRHLNLVADGFRLSYVEFYDAATQDFLVNIEMET